MATLIRSTQGFNVSVDTESSTFGSPDGSEKYIRVEEAPTLPGLPVKYLDVGNKGFAHFANQDAKSTYESVSEGALGLDLALRKAYSTYSPITRTLNSLLGSMVVTSDDTAIAGSTVSLVGVTGGSPALEAGQAVLVGCNYSAADGYLYFPILAKKVSGAAVTPLVAMPYATAAGYPIKKAVNFTPRSQEIPVGGGTGTSLSIFVNTRQQYDASVGETWRYGYHGCSCSDFGPIKLEPGKKIIFHPKFNVADIEVEEDSLAAEGLTDFGDTAKSVVFGENCWFSLTDYDATNSNCRARPVTEMKLLSAEIDLGCTSKQIESAAGNNLNNCQGYFCTYDPTKAVVTLEMMFDYTIVTNSWLDNTKEFTIEIAQGVRDITDPPFAFWAPRAFLIEPPTCEHFKGSYHTITAKFGLKPNGWSGTAFSNNSDHYNAWYLMVK